MGHPVRSPRAADRRLAAVPIGTTEHIAPVSVTVYVSGPPMRTLTPDLEKRTAALKPGQRRPTAWHESQSEADLTRSRFGGFPHGPQYAITPEHAALWSTWGFRQKLLEMSLEGNEEAELLYLDLAYRDGALRRAQQRLDLDFAQKPLDRYLRDGREEYGCLGAVIREGLRDGRIDPEDFPQAAAAVGYCGNGGPDADLLEHRDEALRVLGTSFSPAQLALLDCGDADLEAGLLQVGERWRQLDELPLYALECYLDLRPDVAPESPLFLSRAANRLTDRQIRRICSERPQGPRRGGRA